MKDTAVNLYDLSVPQFIRVLGQVHKWLDKAEAIATQKKFDPNILVQARLAPDQFPFVRQIHSMTDHAKGAAARLAGVAPTPFADDEKTLAELRSRVDRTIELLKTFKPEQFEGAADRTITLPFIPGKGFKGVDFLATFSLPNFYFHAATAYAILRHNGVDVGKLDFL